MCAYVLMCAYVCLCVHMCLCVLGQHAAAHVCLCVHMCLCVLGQHAAAHVSLMLWPVRLGCHVAGCTPALAACKPHASPAPAGARENALCARTARLGITDVCLGSAVAQLSRDAVPQEGPHLLARDLASETPMVRQRRQAASRDT